jgi:Holliday junction resolvase-like predicted endonuclease
MQQKFQNQKVLKRYCLNQRIVLVETKFRTNKQDKKQAIKVNKMKMKKVKNETTRIPWA